MKKLLVILQNAYGVRRGYVPSYNKRSFRESHTGKRLKEMLPDGIAVNIVNASPRVGEFADAWFEPVPAYVRGMYKRIRPDAILACGKNAQQVVSELQPEVPVVISPHPAFRMLSKKMTSDMRRKLEGLLGSGA